MILIAHDNRGLGTRQADQPLHGLLKKAGIARKAKKLLREAGPRQGPEPGAGATAKDDRREWSHVSASFVESVSIVPRLLPMSTRKDVGDKERAVCKPMPSLGLKPMLQFDCKPQLRSLQPLLIKARQQKNFLA
jgi:hypothetical protein